MPLTQVSSRLIEDTLRYVLGASGTDHYTFTGKGLTGAVNDPTLTLSRGHTYVFENRNSSGAHPFYIKTSIANGGTNDAYNTGVTNNGGAGVTEIVFTVPHDAPDLLYYQCSSHINMAGQLKIAGAVADGSITEAKLADDAVTADKLANSINTAIAANTAKTSNATHTGDVTGSTSLTIADDAVTNAKIALNAVGTTEIADEAVTLAKLPHGDGSSDGKFLRANNGADPTFETIATVDTPIVKIATRRYTGFHQTTGITNTFVRMDQAYVDITPSSASNRIRLLCLFCWEGSDTENQYNFRWRREESGQSAVSIDDSLEVGNRHSVHYKDSGSGGLITAHLAPIYDNPQTTNAIRYYLDVSCDAGGAGQTLYINRTHADANDPRDERGGSYFTAEEVNNSIHTFTDDT